jgi:hypothetical protein
MPALHGAAFTPGPGQEAFSPCVRYDALPKAPARPLKEFSARFAGGVLPVALRSSARVCHSGRSKKKTRHTANSERVHWYLAPSSFGSMLLNKIRQ